MKLQGKKNWLSLWLKVNQQAQLGSILSLSQRNRSMWFQLTFYSNFFFLVFFSLFEHETAGKKAGSKICNCLDILSAYYFSRVQFSCNLLVIKKKRRFFVLFCIIWNPHAMLIITMSWYCGNIMWFIICTDLILFSHVWNSTSTCNLFFNVCNASINYFFLISLITWGI